jgi:hypothetical protein
VDRACDTAAVAVDLGAIDAAERHAVRQGIRQVIHATVWYETFATLPFRTPPALDDMRNAIAQVMGTSRAVRRSGDARNALVDPAIDAMDEDVDDEGDDTDGDVPDEVIMAVCTQLNGLLQERDNNVPFVMEVAKTRTINMFDVFSTAADVDLNVFALFRYANVLKKRLTGKGIAPVSQAGRWKSDLTRAFLSQAFDPQWITFDTKKMVDWLFRGELHLSTMCGWLRRYCLDPLHEQLKAAPLALLADAFSTDNDPGHHSRHRPREAMQLGFLDSLGCFQHVSDRRGSREADALTLGAIMSSARHSVLDEVPLNLATRFRQNLLSYQARVKMFLQLPKAASLKACRSKASDNRLVLSQLVFDDRILPQYNYPLFQVSCDGKNFQVICAAINKATWPKEATERGVKVKQPDEQDFEAFNLIKFYGLAGCDEAFSKRCDYGQFFVHSCRRVRVSSKRNNDSGSLEARQIRPLLPRTGTAAATASSVLVSRFARDNQHFLAQGVGCLGLATKRMLHRSIVAQEQTRQGLFTSVTKLTTETAPHWSDYLAFVTAPGHTGALPGFKDPIVAGSFDRLGIDYSGLNFAAVDQGFAFPNAIFLRVAPRAEAVGSDTGASVLEDLRGEDDDLDVDDNFETGSRIGSTSQRSSAASSFDSSAAGPASSGARQLTLLQSPHGLQEMIKVHSRKLGWHMRRFPLDLDAFARAKHPAYATLRILFRHSADALNEDWHLRKRQSCYYERAIEQFLERSGLRSPDQLPNSAAQRRRLGVAALLKKPKALLFLIGDGCGTGAGFKQRTADFRNEFLRRLIKRCRDECLPAVFLRVSEDWSSQVCPRPECLKARDGTGSQLIRSW